MTTMSVIPDVIDSRATNNPKAKSDFLFRLDASLRIKRMRDVYMTQEEAAYWTAELVHEFVYSIPDDDVETLNTVPNEDVRMFFDDMVMDLVYAKNVINALMG